MELAEALYYFRQARRHFDEIAEARKKGNKGGGGSGSTTETHTDGWVTEDEDRSENADEDEDVSVESLMDD